MKLKATKRLNTHFEPYPHDHPRAETKEDGSEVHKFRFPIPRGVLSPRMSALEIRTFIINHMRGILGMGLLKGLRPDIEAEFHIIFRRLMFTPPEQLDELQPWIRIEYHERDDDAIFINLNEKRPQLAGPMYSMPFTYGFSPAKKSEPFIPPIERVSAEADRIAETKRRWSNH